MSELSLPEKITALHQRLDEAKIPHAFGGALALAYYAEPRATIDIDLNVFLPPAEFRKLFEAITPLGIDDPANATALKRDGQCRVWWGRTPLDLFFSNATIHDEMRRDARTVPFGDDEVPILAPEHLVICKALFDRPKDWLDIEQVLVSTEHLHASVISDWLGDNLGVEDPRKRHFDQLAGELLDR